MTGPTTCDAAPPTYRDWNDWDTHMSGEGGGLSTLPVDERYPTRGKARQGFATEWGESFMEVPSVRKVRMVWDPRAAAEEYREMRCEDSEEPCGAFDKDGKRTGQPCTCPWPKDIGDFWDEDGTYCPWRPARDTDPPENIVAMWKVDAP